jgi:hypothetical protein
MIIVNSAKLHVQNDWKAFTIFKGKGRCTADDLIDSFKSIGLFNVTARPICHFDASGFRSGCFEGGEAGDKGFMGCEPIS